MKIISSNNQLGMSRPNLFYLNPDKSNQGLRHYQFVVSLDRYGGSYDTSMIYQVEYVF